MNYFEELGRAFMIDRISVYYIGDMNSYQRNDLQY